MKKLRIAVSQFPVSENIKKNEAYISRHIVYASQKDADIIHFPETSLSGYETTVASMDWDSLESSLNRIKSFAKQYKINVVLGLHQKRKQEAKPYNCIYLISKLGQIAGTYVKTNLYKKEKARFSAKDNFLISKINDINCGFLICYDSCFPELFQYYRKKNVKIIFLSYCNARSSRNKNSLDDLMKAQLRTRAADNMMYISASNSSGRYSRMPSGIASPDGKIVSLERHKAGILVYDYPQKSLGWTYDNSKSN